MKDCNECILKMAAESELIKLKKENEELLKERDSMFTLLDLFLDAVKLWGQQHGVIKADETLNGSIVGNINEISATFNQPSEDKKSAMSRRMADLLDAFNKINEVSYGSNNLQEY